MEFDHPGTARVSCSSACPEHPSLPLAHCTLREVVTLLKVTVAVGHQGAAMDHHIQGRTGKLGMLREGGGSERKFGYQRATKVARRNFEWLAFKYLYVLETVSMAIWCSR